ncbi:hypothetical protein [Actinacidiphila alni]|uniref:hypothetical protein n=1 Tax=Actinacidiphila alni TaxID=380248 RepID=UPI003456BE7A
MTAAENPEDGDELFVLTAAMLTPGQFPGVLGDDYPAACAELGLEPLAGGYGLVFGQDGGGARWTVVTTDTVTVACALAAWDCGLEYDLAPDENCLAASLPGWPLPVAVAVPNIPAPHDPSEEEAGRPPLAPPDVSVWGPPQRRLGADEIAVRWFEWRDQLGGPAASPSSADEAAPVTETADADTDAGTDTAPAADTDTDSDTSPAADATGAEDRSEPSAAAPPSISHSGIRHVLESAEEYVRNPPPPGRVRSGHGGAVRADGPGWSLVARTDDIAFVLLDDAPGEVLPVGRGAALPPLLEALSRLAASTAAAR